MSRTYIERYQLWKEKGEYPIDEEGVLRISPYWSRAVSLSAKRRNQKIFVMDVFIVVVGMALLYYGYMGLFR